jgi:hypothetical protein
VPGGGWGVNPQKPRVVQDLPTHIIGPASWQELLASRGCIMSTRYLKTANPYRVRVGRSC